MDIRQIIAVTVWVPPMLVYGHCEDEERVMGWRERRGGSKEQKEGLVT